jgi:hypothetical protein
MVVFFPIKRSTSVSMKVVSLQEIQPDFVQEAKA